MLVFTTVKGCGWLNAYDGITLELSSLLVSLSAPLFRVESSAMRLYKDSLVGQIFSSRPLLVAAIGPG
jgi:hypothetical protein